MASRDLNTFKTAYAGIAPWDIDGPQPGFAAISDKVKGSILDAGCGTGENALFFSSLKHDVIGIDFLEEPIRRARAKAAERDLSANFRVMNALDLPQIFERFDNVIDSGLFHVFDDANRKKYVSALASVLKPGGRVFLLCFSDKEPGEQGPRRVSRAELEQAFAAGWKIESIQPTQFQIRSDFTQVQFSEGGPHAWLVIASRQ